MPAFAKTAPVTQANQNTTQRKLALANANSDISVITRIDYNLRFTKQAILVVSNSNDLHSQLANEFLVSLSETSVEEQENQLNVAYVSASTKLNDIQIRCRLIEQLFVNTLFDPEQSLANSVLEFAKLQGESISIVIDNAHTLSLQVKYELCQLVYLAKKSQYKVNVVLFGLIEAAQELSINKSLVKSKLVVIDASSGQVISLDDKCMNLDKEPISITKVQKLSLMAISMLVMGALIWAYLLIPPSTNQSTVTASQKLTRMVLPVAGMSNEIPALDGQAPMLKKQKIKEQSQLRSIPQKSQATSEEIHSALLAFAPVNTKDQTPAKVNDVMAALTIQNDSKNISVANKQTMAVESVVNNKTEIEKIKGVDSSYYLNMGSEYEEGYVIQIAGFSDSNLWQNFIANNSSERLFSYQRLLSGNNFIVITSNVYPSKVKAKAAMDKLSITLKNRKPWLKSISSVIKEINTFKR